MSLGDLFAEVNVPVIAPRSALEAETLHIRDIFDGDDGEAIYKTQLTGEHLHKLSLGKQISFAGTFEGVVVDHPNLLINAEINRRTYLEIWSERIDVVADLFGLKKGPGTLRSIMKTVAGVATAWKPRLITLGMYDFSLDYIKDWLLPRMKVVVSWFLTSWTLDFQLDLRDLKSSSFTELVGKIVRKIQPKCLTNAECGGSTPFCDHRVQAGERKVSTLSNGSYTVATATDGSGWGCVASCGPNANGVWRDWIGCFDAKEDGAGCMFDSECKSRRCGYFKCGGCEKTSDCDITKYCVLGTCKKRKGLEAKCLWDNQCLSGNCRYKFPFFRCGACQPGDAECVPPPSSLEVGIESSALSSIKTETFPDQVTSLGIALKMSFIVKVVGTHAEVTRTSQTLHFSATSDVERVVANEELRTHCAPETAITMNGAGSAYYRKFGCSLFATPRRNELGMTTISLLITDDVPETGSLSRSFKLRVEDRAQLTATIDRATNLHYGDGIAGVSDAYVQVFTNDPVVSPDPTTLLGTTRTVIDAHNPVWNEALDLGVVSKDQFIKFAVWDKDDDGSDDDLGTASVNLRACARSGDCSPKFTLTKGTNAELQVDLQFAIGQSDPIRNIIVGCESMSEQFGATCTSTVPTGYTRLSTNLNKGIASAPKLHLYYTREVTLEVEVVRGISLKDEDPLWGTGVSDPYARVILKGQTQTTSTRSDTSNPIWSQAKFNFGPIDIAKDILTIELMDEDVVWSDFIGKASLPLSECGDESESGSLYDKNEDASSNAGGCRKILTLSNGGGKVEVILRFIGMNPITDISVGLEDKSDTVPFQYERIPLNLNFGVPASAFQGKKTSRAYLYLGRHGNTHEKRPIIDIEVGDESPKSTSSIQVPPERYIRVGKDMNHGTLQGANLFLYFKRKYAPLANAVPLACEWLDEMAVVSNGDSMLNQLEQDMPAATCPIGSISNGFYSSYDASKKDRAWRMKCCKMMSHNFTDLDFERESPSMAASLPAHAFMQSESRWITAAAGSGGSPKDDLLLTCPDLFVVDGIKSTWDATTNDRIWSTRCSRINNTVTNQCYWTSAANTLELGDTDLRGGCDIENSEALTGVQSRFVEGVADREWRFQCCMMVIPTDSEMDELENEGCATAFPTTSAVNAMRDDAVQDVDRTGKMDPTSRQITINDKSTAGFRFALQVPRATSLCDARLFMKADKTEEKTSTIEISLEDSANARDYGLEEKTIVDRPRTQRTVLWSPGPWVKGRWYQTPSLKNLLAAITSKQAWVYGNYISVVLQGATASSSRIAKR